MPDFVFQQADHAIEGSGRRELGDRLLLAGRRGAVVQVKARTTKPKPDSQEVAWIQKVAAKAMSQAKGTVRQLRMLPADMVNGRGRTLQVDGNIYEWVAGSRCSCWITLRSRRAPRSPGSRSGCLPSR